MLGDGMVSFGVAVVDVVLEEREGVCEDRVVESDTGPLDLAVPLT